MRLAILFGLVLLASSCGNRASLSPEESTSVYHISTPLAQTPAFLATEEELAIAWSSYKDVNQLRQPETGTIIVKGVVDYFDETLGNYAHVSLRVKVVDQAVTMTAVIGSEKNNAFPSENAVKQIRTKLAAMAAEIATALKGKVESGA